MKSNYCKYSEHSTWMWLISKFIYLDINLSVNLEPIWILLLCNLRNRIMMMSMYIRVHDMNFMSLECQTSKGITVKQATVYPTYMTILMILNSIACAVPLLEKCSQFCKQVLLLHF